MAIQKSINLPSGICIEHAYIKVAEVLVFGVATKEQDPPALHATARWDVFANRESCEVGSQVVMSGQAMFVVNGLDAVLPQAYAHLNTLPQFEGAIDC